MATRPKTPSKHNSTNAQSASKQSVRRENSPFAYGGDKSSKSKRNGSITSPTIQTPPKKTVEKTVLKPPKQIILNENENNSIPTTTKPNSKNPVTPNLIKERAIQFDGRDKINYPSHTDSQLGNQPKDKDVSVTRGVNKQIFQITTPPTVSYTNSKYSDTPSTQFSTQGTSNKFTHNPISSTHQSSSTNSSEIITNITRQPIPHYTSQQTKYTYKQTPTSAISPKSITTGQPLTQQTKYTEQATPTLEKPICGLKNLGNTCFMNCILQCLSHTLPLRQFYVSREYKQALNKRGDLSGAFSNVMVELWDVSSHSVAPYELKRQVGIVAPRFSGFNQHDAQEFMRFLLNELHDEINRASVKGRKPPADNETLEDACARYLTWENSWISELYGGMLRSVVCCTVCDRTSTVYDPFMDLALPIPKGKSTYQFSISYDVSHHSAVQLTDCLEKFTDEETLDEEERPYCNKCKKLTKSTKQLGIAKLPRFLVIQLKRFSGYQVRSKLSTPVSFDNTWELRDVNDKSHTYSLYGIVSHSGGIYGGHYTAYCEYDGIWRCFNDTMCREFSWEYVKHQEAYILFYEKEDII